MATNKIESLDPALIRPGRIDRKIEFPLPDQKTKMWVSIERKKWPASNLDCWLFDVVPSILDRHIFRLHTSRMNLDEDVNLEEFVAMKDDLSGADIKSLVSWDEAFPCWFSFNCGNWSCFLLDLCRLLRLVFWLCVSVEWESPRRLVFHLVPSSPPLFSRQTISYFFSALLYLQQDFTTARERVIDRKQEGTPEGLYL